MAANKRLLRSDRERGAVIVEMAIVMPLLLLILAGVVDLGLLIWEKEVMTNAAREGARAGVRATIDAKPEKPTMAATRAIVQTYLTNNGLKDPAGGNIALTPTNCVITVDGANPPNLTVTLRNIPVKMMLLPNIQTLFGPGGVDNVVTLDAAVTMAAEWAAATPPTAP